jgi:hypothetical protein
MLFIGSMSTRNVHHHRQDIRVAHVDNFGDSLLDFECIAPHAGTLTLRITPNPVQNGDDVEDLPAFGGPPPYQVWDHGPALAPFNDAELLAPLIFNEIHYLLDYRHNYSIIVTGQENRFRYETLDARNPNPRPIWFHRLELIIQIQNATQAV